MTTSTSIAAACIEGWADLPAPASPFVVGVVPGEGIGPEVIAATCTVLDAVAETFGVKFQLPSAPPLGPPGPFGQTLAPDMADYFDDVFSIGGPVICGAVGGRFVYELRARFSLYCKLVPVRPVPTLRDASIVRPERLSDVDVLIVRDNVGGLYQGEFGRRDEGRVAYQEAAYDTDQVDRLLRVAVRAAHARRGRLAVVTKAGGIPEVSALWRERADAATADADITIDEVDVDNACFQLVANPARFDVVAAPNLLGDVVADSAALVLGSRGMALSGNFGADGRAVYQTGHGAAYDLAGTDDANPVAQIQSLAMLLRESLGLAEAARCVEDAVVSVLASGIRTRDIAGPTSRIVGTRALADAVAMSVSEASVPSAARSD